jgi:hypothetical protein
MIALILDVMVAVLTYYMKREREVLELSRSIKDV